MEYCIYLHLVDFYGIHVGKYTIHGTFLGKIQISIVMVAKPDMTYNTAKRRIKASGITTMMSPMFSSCFLAAKKLKLSTTNLQTPPSPKIDVPSKKRFVILCLELKMG